MGLFKPDPPDPPDYTPIGDAYEKMAELYNGLQQDQLDWAKAQNEEDRAILREVLSVQLPMMEAQAEQARLMQDRYNEVFLPLEDELVEQYTQYADPAFQEQRAEEAMQDVASQFDAQREQALMRLEGYGIDPSQTRSQALDLGVRTQQAAAQALAGNQARNQARTQGLALMGDVVNLGRGVPSQVGASAGTALQAGNSANTNAGNVTGNFMGALGNPTAWASGALGAVGGQMDAMSNQWNANLGAFRAGNEASSNFWGGLGGVAGLAMSPMPAGGWGGTIGGSILGFEEGGPVPDHLSPSNGIIPDDVPAALTPGEYVIPEDVVRYKGEEFFEKLIGKTRTRGEDGGTSDGAGADGVQRRAMGGPITRYRPQGALGMAMGGAGLPAPGGAGGGAPASSGAPGGGALPIIYRPQGQDRPAPQGPSAHERAVWNSGARQRGGFEGMLARLDTAIQEGQGLPALAPLGMFGGAGVPLMAAQIGQGINTGRSNYSAGGALGAAIGRGLGVGGNYDRDRDYAGFSEQNFERAANAETMRDHARDRI